MDSINLGILGPFIFALLEGVKRAGVPTRYIAIASLMLSVAVAILVAWGGQWDPVAILTNAGAIYLAVEGAVKNSRRPGLLAAREDEDDEGEDVDAASRAGRRGAAGDGG